MNLNEIENMQEKKMIEIWDKFACRSNDVRMDYSCSHACHAWLRCDMQTDTPYYTVWILTRSVQLQKVCLFHTTSYSLSFIFFYQYSMILL